MDAMLTPFTYLCDGEFITIAEYEAANPDDADLLNALCKLKVGETYWTGGGAAAEFHIKRVA